MDIPQTDLEKFLQDTGDLAVIHLVTFRAVITGKLVKTTGTNTVYLRNVSIVTKFQIMQLNETLVPYEEVISWGVGRK